MLHRLREKMVFSDDEEDKTYSVKELREFFAKSSREKAKVDSDLHA